MYNAETIQVGLTVALLCYPISKYASQIEHLPCKKDAAHIPVSLQLYNIPHLVHWWAHPSIFFTSNLNM